MAKIQIYARIRPTKKRYSGIKTCGENSEINVTIGDIEEEKFQVRHAKTPGVKHEFRFNKVFEADATQDQVFETVAREITDSFIEGFNATMFAYGQTSSGKTHTIEGGSRKFSDRGLIPRVLSYVYRSLEKRSENEEVSVHISYMEIYQDVGFDLLNPGTRPGALMVTLPKVHICEGPTGEVLVRNLSSHLASSEEVAQSLLFQGSTCRRVAETSMNQSSSRSHTIFSITLTSKPAHSEVITRSKLNLVDLAGSERVAKTGADNLVLQEAKHINLSLHHLEHVIVSLQQQARHRDGASQLDASSFSSSRSSSSSPAGRHSSTGGTRNSTGSRNSPGSRNTSIGSRDGASGFSRLKSQQSPNRSKGRRSNEMMMVSPSRDRLFYSSPARSRSGTRPRTRSGHIPYRNCMLTMVLRDSLGGNCLTAMIATISAEERNICETVSTCRFSQRVACIANKARRNEELDDKAVIKKLKLRVAELEREMATTREQTPTIQQVSLEQSQGSLSEADRLLCHRILHDFFHGKTENPVAAGIDTVPKFQECLKVLKDIVLHALGINRDASRPLHSLQPSTTTSTNPTSEPKTKTHHRKKDSKSKRSKHRAMENSSLQAEESPVAIATPDASLRVDPRRVCSSDGASVSPHTRSRLSSGFGSLNEEGDPLVESGNHRLSLRQATEQQSSPRSRESLKANLMTAYSDVSTPRSTVEEYSQHTPHRSHTIPMQSQLHTSPRTTTQQPISPPSFKQTSPNIPTHRSPEDHYPPRLQKSLSPRVVTNLQHLKTKQVELQASRQEQKLLTDNVLLLDLRVQEEGLRRELARNGEQLAAQHCSLSRAIQQQADSKLVYTEKLAEQQLQIKQAKLYQKLTDTQSQLRALQQQQQHSTGEGSSQTLAGGSLMQQQQQQAWLSASQVQSELTKHELRQSKVQEQIESLRISQLEKQLALKEASTRSKILSLKQQLLHVPPAASETPRSAPASMGQTATSSSTQFSPPPSTLQPPSTQFSPSLLAPKSSPTTQFSATSSTTVQHAPLTSVVPHKSPDIAPPSSRQKPASLASPNSKAQTVPSLPITIQAWSKPTSPLAHKQLANIATESRNSTLTADSTTTSPSYKETESVKAKTKLTLPEEVKETEYMTALQRQKARVSRIRRCIVAATVIQRAWREYKQIF